MKNNSTQKNIPSGWKEGHMKTYGSCVRGVSYSPKDLRHVIDGSSIKLLRSNNIKDDKLNLSDVQIVSKEKVSSEQVLKKGDIFICMSNGSKSLVGKNVYIDNDAGYTVGAFCALFHPDSEKIVPSFVKQLFLSSSYIKQIQDSLAGTSINNLKNSHIEDLKFLFPSKKEQQKIAEILGVVDEDIAKAQEVVEATEKLKRGLMQQLFTRGIGHTKFKETKIGQIPEGWEVGKVGDLFKSVIGGGTPSRKETKYWNGDIPWMTVKDMSNKKYVYDTEEYITEAGLKESSSSLIPENNLITSTRMGIGRVYVNKVPIAINQDLKGLVPKSDFILDYTYWLILSVAKQLEAKGTGSTVKGIRLEDFKSLEIGLTTNKIEQNKIAELLSAVDEKISVNKKLKGKLTLLKKGLMQDLLSGRVRVIIN